MIQDVPSVPHINLLYPSIVQWYGESATIRFTIAVCSFGLNRTIGAPCASKSGRYRGLGVSQLSRHPISKEFNHNLLNILLYFNFVEFDRIY